MLAVDSYVRRTDITVEGARSGEPEHADVTMVSGDYFRILGIRPFRDRIHQIEAEIRYDDRVLRLRIRDDGTGIDPKVLDEGGRSGHWGLLGIRERAKRIGARLDFWSQAGAGTEVELTVPASIAYGTSRDGPGFKLFRKKRGDS